ncbi:MAG: flagellar brake protein [Synergistaceae bacterium]|nr:flagellar brake protein [Synergistaceae bacterium]
MPQETEEARKLLDNLIGSRIELVITSGLYKGSYNSTLEELEDGLAGVYHPTLKGAFLPALRGTSLLMKIETPNCIYQADTVASRSSLNVAIPLLWLKLVTPLEKLQRRMFVRVPTSISANAFFLGGPEMEDLPADAVLPPSEWFSVRISDISLGGIGLSLKENLVPYCLEGGRYLLSMKIGGNSFFIVGKLVKILGKKTSNTVVGFAYESLSVSAEKIMGGYIRQQELMTRG